MDVKGSFPLLQIRDLSIAFANGTQLVPAVNNLSLDIHQKEIVALVGESGSGKSITALSILQLLPSPPAVYISGQILFSPDGTHQQDLLQSKDIRKVRGAQIAMIFQEPMSALNPVMRCGKQVQEVLLQHQAISPKAAKEKAIEWLDKVKIPEPRKAYEKYPHQMSGGQKQRVMIAMAMCCRPALLICDEPTTALDVTVQQHILELIASLQQESGMGVLFITHDLGVVAQIAHRSAILYRGDMIESGNTSTLLASPQQPYTKALLACRPANQPRAQRLPVVSDFLTPSVSIPSVAAVNTATHSETPLVTVQDLQVSFVVKKNWWGKPLEQFHAVDDISFTIQKGETLGLVGESGCGKTTLGNALLGLVPPSSGRIDISGLDITAMDKRKWARFRKEVQLVFQDPFAALNPRLSIGDAIAEPLWQQGAFAAKDIRSQVRRLLQMVQLPTGAEERYPHQFSGGQRQRIVIARALAPGPSFLVCDESVSALDVSVQAQVLNLLNDLKRELGLTVLFISHDLGVVRYISDRIMVMHRGHIVESGDADQVFYHPSQPYTRSLLAAIPKV